MNDLDALLRDAAAADGMTRIGYRDRIAAFGAEAVRRLEPWLADPRLAPFAVRTIECAAAMPGALASARTALERADVTGTTRRDIDAALMGLGGSPRLRPASQPRGDEPASPWQAPSASLLLRFDDAMLEVYEHAKVEAGYTATRFLQKVRRDGGHETARYLLRMHGVSKGFLGLWKAAKLDLTVEYLVLRPEFAALFTDDERAIARQRLLDYGMRPARLV